MKVQVGKWGNSLAVRLPKAFAERYRLGDGSELDLTPLETALEAAEQEHLQRQREEALKRLRALRWTLPEGWKFDRDEAHERGPL